MKLLQQSRISLGIMSLLLTSVTGFSQLTPNGAYLLGNVAEVGINNKGHEGTFAIAGDHSRSDQFDASVFFGFVANPQNDGWVNYDGDFFTPGTPENGFGIEVNGINYSNNATWENQIPGVLSNFQTDGNCMSVQWNGTVANVGVQVVYSFVTTELYYTTEVTLTNNSGAAMNNVYYYRNFDPDNNVSINTMWDYSTQNTIVAQPVPACPKALVSATSVNPWFSYVGLAAIGQQFRVSYGGFSNRDASDIWNGIAPMVGTTGSTNFNDEAISLAYRINTLPAGASETFEFAVILDDAQVDAAFAQLYSFNYPGYVGGGTVCNPVSDTAFVPCPGSTVTLSVNGPGVADYSWVWSPPTGLSTTTGHTVDASPGSTTTYTVTGTPINPCMALTISKEIVVHVGIGPLVQITDPGSVCGAFDLTTLVVTDLNGIPGTTTTFHSVPPTTATDMANLWPTNTISDGDVVYVMIADAVGGCFDYEQVIINFGGGSTAGADNSSSLCNSAGTTLDLNTLLSGTANPGGTWAETTPVPSGQFTSGTGVLDASDLTAGVYTFSYTTSVVAPCLPDVAIMTITIEQYAVAGSDDNTSICNTAGGTVDLNGLVSGNNGIGVWAETSSSGQFDPVTGVFTSTSLAANNYTFTYTVTGATPCLADIADFTVTVEQEALAGADNSTTDCNVPGSSVDLNTLLSGNNAIGVWAETSSSGQFNTATGILDASGLTPGTYTFTYTVSGTAPCIDDVANFSVVITPLPNAGSDNSASLCNGSGTLNLSTLLSGANPGGAWAETTAIPSGQFTPSTSFFDASGVPAGVYTFTYSINPSGPCAGDQAVFTITVEQNANAGLDNSAILCNAFGTLNLNTLLSGNNGIGVWTETTSSGQFNPITGVFTSTGLTAGSYSFNYLVDAVAPCVSDDATFTVIVIDQPNAGLDSAIVVCNTAGSSINIPSLMNGANIFGFITETTPAPSGQYDPTTGIFSTGGLATGVYTFTHSVPPIGACAGDQAVYTITVITEPQINDLADQTHCDSYTLPAITGTSLTGNQAYYTGPNGTGTQFAPGAIITSSQLLYIYDETGTTPNCSDEQTVTITINQTPVVVFEADTTSGCAPLTVTFTNLTAGTSQNCVWNFGNGGYGQMCGTQTHTYTTPGVYTVSLNLQGAGGCASSATYTAYITVEAQPIASFSFLPQLPNIDDSEVEFTNASLLSTHYVWEFGDGATSTDTDPVHEYPVLPNVDYTAVLYAYNDLGCMDSLVQIITVEDVLTFYIPNTFTPDGDQLNQYFLPVFTSGFDPYDFHMTVFNRWGEIMFESHNALNGWNGTYGDQGLVDEGVFIWQIEFKETMSDKRHMHTGHVTILK